MSKISEKVNIAVCVGVVLLILLPVGRAVGASDNASKLLKLAGEKIGNLTQAEEELLRKVANNQVADFSDKLEENNDPNAAEKWGDERVIRAILIWWLCTNPEASGMVTYWGIHVKGVRIDGELNLSHARISFALYFEKSAFTGGIYLRQAEIRHLCLDGTHTGPIYGYGLKVEGSVFLRHGFKAEGEVELLDARIAGTLECDGGEFINPAGYALRADGAKVEGSVYLRNGFKAEGKVRLVGATIGGNLECDDSEFINPKGYALNANGVKVEGSVYLRNGFKGQGVVDLIGATIGGVLDCCDGQFINPEGYALLADGANIKGTVYLRGTFKAEGEVRLVTATVGGNLDCVGSQFIKPKGYALRVGGANITGSVYLRNGFKAEGEVNLLKATIGGNLECIGGRFINKGAYALNADGLKVEGSVSLNNGFKAEGEVRLLGATIGGDLSCVDGEFINPKGYALNAAGLNVKGYVYLREDFKADGEVNLVGATIGGNLECDGSQLVNKGAKALSADGLKVEGSVFLRDGFKAEGEVRLLGATIGGVLDCSGGRFINKGAYALNADAINIGGSVFLCEGFKAEGEVNLLGATIGGVLDCNDGRFIHPTGYALSADNVNIKTSAYLRGGFQAEGVVSLVGATIGGHFIWMDVNSPEDVILDLRSATVGTLWDDADSWPDEGKLLLHGLVYKEIHDDAPRDAESRKDWLRRQYDDKAEKDKEQFRPQPYEQLAAVFRKGGRDGEARKILIAKNEDRSRLTKLTWSEKCWYRVLGRMIGYGYRPLNALWGVAAFVALGAFLFGIGYCLGLVTPQSESAYVVKSVSNAAGGAESRELSDVYPRFNFLVYSIDTFVPLIDLHQGKYWLPNANRGPGLLNIKTGGLLRLYLWIHITMGWALTMLLVAGLTGLVRT